MPQSLVRGLAGLCYRSPILCHFLDNADTIKVIMGNIGSRTRPVMRSETMLLLENTRCMRAGGAGPG